jgi:hypothetical protein
LDELKRLEELEDSNRRLLERASALQGTIDRVEALAAVWKNRAFLVIAIFFSAIALLSCYPMLRTSSTPRRYRAIIHR